ncbi:hypothetical protein MRX96_044628 [Rhipicephalus microplus]
MSSLVSEGFRAKLKTLKSNGRIELTEDVATGVARLNINDPAKRNCISGEMMLELENAVETLEHWSHIKAVLMCGEGSFLCSGANLTSMKAISAPDEGRQMSALMQSTLTRFSNLPMITAVLVEGRAIGGGSRADHGSGLPHHGTQLRSPVRPRAHGDHFCVGRHDTANADCWSHIGVGSDTKEQALQWISERIKGTTEIMRAIKLGMVAARNLPLQEALQRENELFASVWGQDAHSDALRQNMKH